MTAHMTDPREAGAGSALAAIQADLYDLITAPEGVGKRLAELGRAPADLERTVRPNHRLSAVARLDVYANMYFDRLHDVLRDEYARVLALLGDVVFHNFVTDYLLAHRPSHPSLREAGAALPGYLAGHPLANPRPWLAELARLERTHLDLFDGPDADPLGLDALRALPPAKLPAMILRAIPCHALLRFGHPIATLWREPASAAAVVRDAPETLLVWRRDLGVYHRSVAADEAPLVDLLAAGASFEAICTRLLESIPEPQAAHRAFELLAAWASEGLLRG